MLDLEADAGDCYLETDPRVLERCFDIGCEPIQLDGALHQAPHADQRGEYQNRDECPDPAKHVMGAATHTARRLSMERPDSACRAFGYASRRRRVCVLTTAAGRASVAGQSGITR